MIKFEIKELNTLAANAPISNIGQGQALKSTKNIKQCIIKFGEGTSLKTHSFLIDSQIATHIYLDSETNTVKVDTTDKKIKGLLESKLNNLIKGLLKGHRKGMTLNGVGYWIKLNKSSEPQFVEMNIGYKNSIKKEIPKEIIVYVNNESSNNNEKLSLSANEIVCESYDLDKLTGWMSSIRQLKPGYKDKYKQKGWSDIYWYNK